MLSPEQVEQIKSQLFSQIENFPEDKKQSAREQIESMDGSQLEEFLKQNGMINDSGEVGASEGRQCIFCSIGSGQAQAYKVDENEKAVAVLELNPVSVGHAIIIPKEHIADIESMPKEAKDLAECVSKRMKEVFKPKDVKIENSNMFGHEILNVYGVYESETLNSLKRQANPEELAELQNQLEKKPEPEVIEKAKVEVIDGDNVWLPVRVP